MRKYFTLVYITFSVMSFAQFENNVFDESKSTHLNSATEANAQATYNPSESTSSSAIGVPPGDDHEEAPGNPGEPTVPIDGMVGVLLIIGLAMIFYFQRKNKNINI